MDDFKGDSAVMQTDTLASHIARLYGWMFAGLMVTGVVAGFVVASNILLTPTMLLLLLVAEVALVWGLSARAMKMEFASAATWFIVYSGLNGLTLSTIFYAYTSGSIAMAFLISALFFGFMSVYGLVTKNDLTSMGSLLFMGLIGVVIASVVNMFLGSPALDWLISFIGVAVFLGLTAYNTQGIKQTYAMYAGTPKERNVAIIGALTLYLNFINLFLFILRILGRRSD